MEQPRRSSKLEDDNPFEAPPKRSDQEQSTVTEVEAPRVEQQPAATATPTGAGSAPVSRNARRLTLRQNVSDEDMVSFNCKMSRGLRRSVRHYAADVEVDIQDVVAAALVEYLQARDRPVPASELQQPD